MASAGGVSAVRQGLKDAGLELPDATVRSWSQRAGGAGSIPPEYWPTFARLGWATLDELAAATETQRLGPVLRTAKDPEAIAP